MIDEDFNQLHDEVEERNYFTQQLPNMRLAWHTKFEDKIRMEQEAKGRVAQEEMRRLELATQLQAALNQIIHERKE